ncbi:MAG: archease [Actinobacteria bacterium]|nr:archease [Actinomycetota bacterium]
MLSAEEDPTATGTYQVAGLGSDLGIDVAGPTPEACLTAAVAGLAAAVGEADETATRHDAPITVTGDAPVDLLVGLLDEVIARLDADGELAVGLTGAQLDDEGLHGVLELVALADVSVRRRTPKAATWHGARLTPAGDRWTGHVMIDL